MEYMWIGDLIILLSAMVALGYGVRSLLDKKNALYFRLIVYAVGCHILGYVFDLCELLTTGTLAEGFTIGYLGNIGSFLFLLTATFGYLDGIIDDKTSAMRESRLVSLIAPIIAAPLLVLNFFADVPMSTKICYLFVWIPAMASTYFNLKHAIAPDMGFGFVKAIRPFNVWAVMFTLLQLVHLTLWNYCGWLPLTISGVLLGTSTVIMVIMAKRGVKGWIL